MEKKTEHSGRDKDRDTIRQMWAGLSLAEKGKYIASYYGLAAIAMIFAVIVIIFFVSDICKKKTEDAFSIMVADMDLPEDITERMEQELSGILGLDPGLQQCRIEAGYSGRANMQSEATISAYMRSGRVDVIIASEEIFNRYAAAGYLSALRDCGLEELEERCSAEELFYAKAVDYSKGQAITDIPCSPHEAAPDARCYGIYLQGEPFGGYVAGVVANCPNPERVRAGMEYFLTIRLQSANSLACNLL